MSHSPFPGKWSFAIDLEEYNGLYIYDFTADGRILREHYREGFSINDEPEISLFGFYSLPSANEIIFRGQDGSEAHYRIDLKEMRLVHELGETNGVIYLRRAEGCPELYSRKRAIARDSNEGTATSP